MPKRKSGWNEPTEKPKKKPPKDVYKKAFKKLKKDFNGKLGKKKKK